MALGTTLTRRDVWQIRRTWGDLTVVAATVATGALATLCGCGGSYEVIKFEPAQAAEVALQTYDKNGDGKLDSKEVVESPALQSSLAKLDTNRDKAIDAGEIQARFEAYKSQSELVGSTVTVTQKRQPLMAATVKIESEPFMGTDLPVQEGTSASDGSVSLSSSSEKMSGLFAPGFYRITISSTGAADFVTGVEIADDLPTAQRIVVDVK
ncbi:MAG: hypothetical protein R3E01_09095 [Pirellulaceae bacterium]|nr:hypothetical protein [Planctomycetales bacterium]